MTSRLCLVGGGRMGEALLAGLLAAEWAPVEDLAVAEPVGSRREQLAERFPGLAVAPEPVAAEGAVVAVKPADVEAACSAIAAAGAPRVLSIAAGVPLRRLEHALGPGTKVVRAMPNTPALVGAGAAAISAGTSASPEDLDWAEGLLSAVGTVVRVPEVLLDAVTGLSGSGPAYVFLVVEALTEAGVLAGLPREVSARLTTQTLLGAARMLDEIGEAPEALRAAVTSPGGTTAAGLRALEAAGVRSAFLEAVAAATARSRELGAG
ncbi:MAG: pyrroline-5-carboxylate reductase [Actinobacteria bacterium]|nr:pyrroline-5-carboxylate reductase [Actinomycetota bacterium]